MRRDDARFDLYPRTPRIARRRRCGLALEERPSTAGCYRGFPWCLSTPKQNSRSLSPERCGNLLPSRLGDPLGLRIENVTRYPCRLPRC